MPFLIYTFGSERWQILSAKHEIFIKKDYLKFSSGHMTVFPNGTKESLHGHNYYVELQATLNGVSKNEMLSFAEFKNEMIEICKGWDEKVLLPSLSPFLKKNKNELEEDFILCQCRYVLPKNEVVWLPVESITTESLSEIFCLSLVKAMKTKSAFINVDSIKLRIEETVGQGAVYHWRNQNEN